MFFFSLFLSLSLTLSPSRPLNPFPPLSFARPLCIFKVRMFILLLVKMKKTQKCHIKILFHLAEKVFFYIHVADLFSCYWHPACSIYYTRVPVEQV